MVNLAAKSKFQFSQPLQKENTSTKQKIKKKDDIATEIVKLVSEMPVSEVCDSYLKDSNRSDRIKQKDLVSLCYEVKQSLDLQLALSSIEPVDDSELLVTVSNDKQHTKTKRVRTVLLQNELTERIKIAITTTFILLLNILPFGQSH